ncbi:MAG: DUF6080 domain-containing protein [Dysgonomonas sp.]
MTKYKFKGSLTQIKLLLQAIIPKDRNEIYLLIGFLIFYLSYSLIIILKSGIIDEVYALDTIFSFDHAKIYKTGVENFESHTLITVFTKPAILTGNFLTKIFGTYKAKTIFLCVLTGALISFSTIYVYRYLQEIAEIKKLPSFILVLFYGLFSTNLIISFTPESYPISAFLLTFSVYYYSCYIKSNKEIPFVSGLCLSMPLGFVTTTNFIKGIVPFFIFE